MKSFTITERHLVLAVMQIAVVTTVVSATLLVTHHNSPTWEDVVHRTIAAEHQPVTP